jgi:hypothetical protein
MIPAAAGVASIPEWQLYGSVCDSAYPLFQTVLDAQI